MPEGRVSAASVCFVLTSLDYGGAETQVIHLASRLKARGWTVRIVSMLAPEAWLDQLASLHIEYASLDMRRGMPPDVRGLYRLVRLLRRWRPHVLHCHMVHANLLGRIARLIAPVPVVISTAHNIDEGGHQREIAYRLTDWLADLTTNVSQAAVDRYIQVGAAPAQRIRFVPNGLDTERFKPDGLARTALRAELDLGDAFVWLAIGRIQREKDYPSMLRAVARMTTKRWVLLIVGRGPDGERIAAQAEEMGLGGRVRFLGVRKDVPELMNAADAYVMSSAWEGLPMVLLEASASGLPVVTTNAGGSSEVVMEGKTGFVVPIGRPGEFAAAMDKVMRMSAATRLDMGRAGRAHVEKYFRLDRVVDVWEGLYEKLLNGKGIAAKPVSSAPAQ